jgi:hypothetical protein
MNRLARLAALARVAGQNLPSAVASEGQVRYLGNKNGVACDHSAKLCSVGVAVELSAVCSRKPMGIRPQQATCFQRSQKILNTLV